jgi:hypothetical protein
MKRYFAELIGTFVLVLRYTHRLLYMRLISGGQHFYAIFNPPQHLNGIRLVIHREYF